ncbi:MAG: hypothetical protein VW547_01960, partial [Alphaproteobacteria bacterium]
MADAPAPSAAAPATAPTSGGGSTSPAPSSAPKTEATAPKAAQKRGTKRPSPAAMDREVKKGLEAKAKERQEKGAALKLVSKGNAPAEQVQAQAAERAEQKATEAPALEQKAPEAQAEAPADDAAKKAADEAAHWTQKAKADLAAKDQQIAQFKDRESQWKAAAQEAVHAREDIEAERDYFRTLFEGARAAIAGLGHEIDPLALKVAEHEFELAKRDRVLKRGEAATKARDEAAQREKMTADLKPRIEALFQKYPALSSKEGREYLRAHVVAGALDSADGLERAAAAFAIARRG